MTKNQMVNVEEVRKWSLALEDVAEQPHFNKTSFRVNGRIFATMDEQKRLVVLKFSEMDQSLFCSFDQTTIRPVKSKWGNHGWTEIVLDKVKKSTFQDALKVAYDHVSSK